jgi:uncharacterized protein YukE
VPDSSSGFEVLPEALTQHAGSIDVGAGALDQAADAGLHVMMGPLAYGVLCQILPTLINPFQGLAVSAIKDEANALRSVSELLREVALRYQNHDQDVDKMFSDLAADGGLSR